MQTHTFFKKPKNSKKKKKKNFGTDDALKFATTATALAIGTTALRNL